MARYTVVSMPGDGVGKVVLPRPSGFWMRGIRRRVRPRRHRLGLLDQGRKRAPRTNGGSPGPAPSGPVRRHHLQAQGGGRGRAESRAQGSRVHLLQPHRGYAAAVQPGCVPPALSVLCREPAQLHPQDSRRRLREPKVDAVIFRQNTEGLYAGIEWTDPPEEVRKTLGLHPKFKRFQETPGNDLALSVRLFTRNACRRIVTAAFEYAKKHGYRSVTVCEKPNVLRETSGMMEEEASRWPRGSPGSSSGRPTSMPR